MLCITLAKTFDASDVPIVLANQLHETCFGKEVDKNRSVAIDPATGILLSSAKCCYYGKDISGAELREYWDLVTGLCGWCNKKIEVINDTDDFILQRLCQGCRESARRDRCVCLRCGHWKRFRVSLPKGYNYTAPPPFDPKWIDATPCGLVDPLIDTGLPKSAKVSGQTKPLPPIDNTKKGLANSKAAKVATKSASSTFPSNQLLASVTTMIETTLKTTPPQYTSRQIATTQHLLIPSASLKSKSVSKHQITKAITTTTTLSVLGNKSTTSTLSRRSHLLSDEITKIGDDEANRLQEQYRILKQARKKALKNGTEPRINAKHKTSATTPPSQNATKKRKASQMAKKKQPQDQDDGEDEEGEDLDQLFAADMYIPHLSPSKRRKTRNDLANPIIGANCSSQFQMAAVPTLPCQMAATYATVDTSTGVQSLIDLSDKRGQQFIQNDEYAQEPSYLSLYDMDIDDYASQPISDNSYGPCVGLMPWAGSENLF